MGSGRGVDTHRPVSRRGRIPWLKIFSVSYIRKSTTSWCSDWRRDLWARRTWLGFLGAAVGEVVRAAIASLGPALADVVLDGLGFCGTIAFS